MIGSLPVVGVGERDDGPKGHFRYIKIQLDSEV